MGLAQSQSHRTEIPGERLPGAPEEKVFGPEAKGGGEGGAHGCWRLEKGGGQEKEFRKARSAYRQGDGANQPGPQGERFGPGAVRSPEQHNPIGAKPQTKTAPAGSGPATLDHQRPVEASPVHPGTGPAPAGTNGNEVPLPGKGGGKTHTANQTGAAVIGHTE